ncbi:MAG: hypothetical protein A2020_10910 [Lentisphaerae bacterium GWF2_45_14]|nr:MAG: hypothetical protein A2020_10910 [Lentisphaerae bacterium GWF2_45_14]
MDIPEIIALGLSACGLKQGDTTLVHCSLRSLGIENAAESLLEGLLRILGEDGTILVPSLSYMTINAEQNFFDINSTPSCAGGFTEYFRKCPGVERSLHPTHSVCGLGKHACAVLSKHQLDNSPCGPNSPYAALRDCGGKIIFIGCGIRPNTSMHGVEETLSPYPPYLFSESVRYILKGADGKISGMDCLRHGFKKFGYVQRYDRIEPLLSSSEMFKGKLMDAEIVVMDARAVWEKGHAALLRDKLFFVEKIN